ncbi:MAG: LytTR family transcriptional regulator [Oscillospiraceae bacterium]|nr:LytTR family transcriptional regulator [Oscillospiraceae bacterium]
MKIKLKLNDDERKNVEKELHEHGIETDDSAEFVLSRVNVFAEKLLVKDKITNERIVVPCDSIVFIESFGHLIDVHTKENVYYSNERLYKILEQLDKTEFLRISNSVIVSKNKIKKITPTLSMKFVLTLCDNTRVDVTRTYYHSFKETFNF